MVRLAPTKRKKARIGPDDDGRRMSLADFEHVDVQEGYLYELGRGVIQVSNVPALKHGLQVRELRHQISAYEQANPEAIYFSGEGGDAKLLISATESERHPDFAIYLSAPPDVKDVWPLWVPDIAIEVVSESSAKRDYEEKPEDYHRLGVREYWIIDAMKEHMTANVRLRGQWKPQIVKPPAKYSTPLLPGFSLNVKKIVAAARRK